MRRTALVLASLAALTSVVSYATEDARSPTRLDSRGALFDLSLAVPRSKLVMTTEGRDALRAEIRTLRARCSDCTILATSPEEAIFDPGPDLAQRLTVEERAAIAGVWTLAFLRLGDVGGAARALVRQYLLVLDRHGLTRENPHGARAPLPPPDPKRLKPRVSNSGSWGAPLAVAIALLALALLPELRIRAGRARSLSESPPVS